MATKTRIGIIGKGNVGTALSRGLERIGHEVRASGKDPAQVKEVAGWADAVILAVPYGERQNAIREAGASNLSGKTLVDVSNVIGEGMRFAGSTDRSGAEEIQEWAGPDCRVVKAFNTVFANHMDKGVALDEQLTLFCAGDDPQSKNEVLDMGRAIGFDAVDAGPLENARWLEPLGYLNINLAYKVGLGPDSGFRYVHAPSQKEGREGTPATRPSRAAPRTDRTEPVAPSTSDSASPARHLPQPQA